MSAPFLAAAVQMLAGRDRERNLAVAEEIVRDAAGAGATLVALPELFYWRGPRDEERDRAEAIPGPTSRWLARLAKDLRIHIVGGSILERPARGSRSYNTSIVAGPTGRVLARYRKVHLFDVDIPGGVTIRESDTRKPGREVVSVKTPLAKLGLSICYDLRFPELYRQLALAGAEVLFVPAAFTYETGRAHWETLLRARAIENLAYVIAPDQVGRARDGMRCYGNSMIVDPWGRVLDKARGRPAYAMAEIDPSAIARARRALPSLEHKRLGVPSAALPRPPSPDGAP